MYLIYILRRRSQGPMQEGIRSFTAGAAGPKSHERRMLNLADLSDQERARVLEAFERLSPGDSLEIVVKQRPGQFVAELQAPYGTRFYWWPLERGPLVWRARLAKPAPDAPAPDAPATVVAVMGADHLRLCQLWRQLERAAELCRLDCIHRRSAELSLGLRRYIDIEEAILFPLLEAQTRMSAGLTRRMRREHLEIKRMLDRLDEIRTTTECAKTLEMFDQLVEPMTLFQHHYRNEEAALYPFMDIVFDCAEKRELFSLLQAFEI